jgi:hypothetical protein
MWEADHGCYGYTFDYFFRASDLLTRVFALGVGPVGGPPARPARPPSDAGYIWVVMLCSNFVLGSPDATFL